MNLKGVALKAAPLNVVPLKAEPLKAVPLKVVEVPSPANEKGVGLPGLLKAPPEPEAGKPKPFEKSPKMAGFYKPTPHRKCENGG